MKKPTVIVAAMLCAIALTFFGYSWQSFSTTQDETARAAETQAFQETLSASAEMDKLLSNVEVIGWELVEELEAGNLAYDDIPAAQKALAKKYPYIFGIGVAFQPYAYSKKRRLHAPYYQRQGGGKWKATTVQSQYDYTRKKHDWFHRPLKKGAGWIEPFYGKASKTMIALFGLPFYAPGGRDTQGEPIGVVFVNLALEELNDILAEMKFRSAGYGMLLSPVGRFYAHPNLDYVKAGKTLFAVDNHVEDADALAATARKAMKGERVFLEAVNTQSGQSAWWIFEPLPTANWVLAVVHVKDSSQGTPVVIRRSMINMTLSGFLALMCLMYIVSVFIATDRARNLFVLSVTVLLTINIGAIWRLAYIYPYFNNEESYRIVDRDTLSSFMEDYRRQSLKRNLDEPLLVPTGLFVQSIEFLGANSIKVTGYLWQKFNKKEHTKVARGVIFPEAEEWNLEKAYTVVQGDTEVVGWYFAITMRQVFDYGQYPLDVNDVWLRMWSTEFYGNVVLVPDLSAYPIISPVSLPGVEEDFVLPDWTLESSFYFFRPHSYSTNFGIPSYVGLTNFPELHFNVQVRRNFLGPFISYLLPTLVVAVILFALLLAMSLDPNENEKHGFDTLGALGACAGLFFGILIGHSQLRGDLNVSGLVYLEGFYILMYFYILLVAVNAYLIMIGRPLSILMYKNNLYPKLFYWPSLLLMVLGMTLYGFY